MSSQCGKCLVSAGILAVAIFIFDFLFHGMLLKDFYESTAHLWREKKEFSLSCMLTSFVYYFVFSAIVVKLFKFFVVPLKEGSLRDNSLKAGVLIGALLGVVNASFYFYMPIPIELAIAWFFGSLSVGVISGYILYLRNHS